MKKTLSITLMLMMIFTISISTVFATGGEGNIEGGGGNMGGGTSQNSWTPGNEGVRVTVVRAEDHKIVTVPLDITNKNPNNIAVHFGKISKKSYTNGNGLTPVTSAYQYINPPISMPKIISTNGSNNIDAIKKYFTSQYLVDLVANHTGMNYDILIGGDYKLLIEPIAYYKFQGVMIATTATEAAMYDQQVNGLLRSKMQSLSHKNLPLAMFLEVGDLGYSAWGGSTTSAASNANIKSSLGLGVVRFTEQPEEPPEISTYDYEYRVNTEVITSVMVEGGQSDPDNDTTVTFNIEGRNHTVSNVYYPEGDSQIVWVKWTTPAEPKDMVIPVTVRGQGSASNGTINVKIVDLDKNPPPNPVADDRNDDFEYADVPSRVEKTDANWSVWSPWWQENWEWESDWEWKSRGCSSSCSDRCSGGHGRWVDNGEWVDNGWWEFDCNRYSASLTVDMEILNDPKNPTATRNSFKSGYGINQEVISRARSNQNSAITKTPNAVSYFPEFGYDTYWRLLERTRSGTNSEFEFQKNNYSTYKNPTHFSPIWMPDGPYEVNTWLIDVWTPVGMLSMNLTDELTVSGSLWDDWHVGPKKP